MEEIWKDIDGYNGDYQISNFGRVKSFKRYTTGKFLTTIRCDNGYYMIRIQKDKKTMRPYIHRLVWDHFGLSKRNGRLLQVDHIDNNKSNNRIDNLQLLSQRENTSKFYLNKNKTAEYTGVYWEKLNKKWKVQIWINNKHIKKLY